MRLRIRVTAASEGFREFEGFSVSGPEPENLRDSLRLRSPATKTSEPERLRLNSRP